MGADRPEEADEPPDGHADHRDDQGTAGGRAPRGGGAEAETRYRQEAYDDLRVAESAQKSLMARRVAAEEQAATEKWDETAERARWIWSEYQRKWPPGDRPSAGTSSDGSWHGEGGGSLKRADNERVEAACDRIAILEEEKITPALRAVESQDPDRHLVGLKDCRKGRDRIKEKVDGMMKEFRYSAEDAVSRVPDTLRFTFQYPEARYTQGVWADTSRMKEQGFELKTCRNSWSDDQYKGINSQWIEPDSGQRIEVQFHTRISYEAKQLTHKAYERLRTRQADALEELVLEAFQRKVAAEVPVPPGATDIPDYP